MFNNSESSKATVKESCRTNDPFILHTLESGVKFVICDIEEAKADDYHELLNNIQDYVLRNNPEALYFFGTELEYKKYKEKVKNTKAIYVDIRKVL